MLIGFETILKSVLYCWYLCDEKYEPLTLHCDLNFAKLGFFTALEKTTRKIHTLYFRLIFTQHIVATGKIFEYIFIKSLFIRLNNPPPFTAYVTVIIAFERDTKYRGKLQYPWSLLPLQRGISSLSKSGIILRDSQWENHNILSTKG